MWRDGRGAAMFLLTATLLVAGGPGGAAAEVPAAPARHALLDVPYLPQTPELCGGAALAMVLRYWGARDVFPQDFASLVDPAQNGIATGTLVSAARDRGWQAMVLPTSDGAHARVRAEVDQGRPLIALIEVGPRTYHYVVIVGTTDGSVVVHDPARTPFRVLTWTEFDRAWTSTDRWAMLVLPTTASSDRREPAADAPATAAPAGAGLAVVTPCDALVASSVDAALAGDAQTAERGLLAASGLCPQSSAPWRELAGLRFSQSRWAEATEMARTAVRLTPSDEYAWQLLGTSRHLMGDAMGALDAWNQTGEPRIDTIDVRGATRTHYPVIARAAGLQPRQLLTPEAYGRAVRRLRELPAVSNAQLRYEPLDGGRARVDVLIDERRVAPRGWLALTTLGGRALLRDELAVDLSGGMGAGERETVLVRWAARRPRVALALALPAPRRLPGILSLEGSWERQSYGSLPLDDAALIQEERRRVGVHLADWSSSWFRWQAGAALDRWRRGTTRDYLALEGAVDARLAGDRLALAASAGLWAPLAGADGFATTTLLTAWRSTTNPTRPSWSALTELGSATQKAPLAVWQGAGTGTGRDGLLRAHGLLDHDVLNGAVFGRQVVRSTFESERPLGRVPIGGLSIAGFVDMARAWHRLSGAAPSRLYVDAGVGARVRAAGGVVRIDVAHGLRGGGTRASVTWGGPWPR